jgi:hypothetical protein
MMSPDPALRPSVDDIFKLEWFASVVDVSEKEKCGMISNLQDQLSFAQDRIAKLELENMMLRAQLMDLDRQ